MFNAILGAADIILLVALIVGLVIVGLYFLNRWAGKRMSQQNEMIEKTKTTVTIYVIDKKKDKVTNAHLPKAVMEQMPKTYRFMKVPLVKVKVGPQIMTVLCDRKVFDALPLKKNVSVELAGIYIISMKGMKSAQEMKEIKKAKKIKQKEEKKKAK